LSHLRPEQLRLGSVGVFAGDVLARYGLNGAVRRYDRQVRDLNHADDMREQENALAWC